MSHDFARSHRIKKEAGSRKAPSRKKKSGGVPFWVWLIVGTALGGLIMFLVYIAGLAPPRPGTASPAAASTQPAPTPEVAAAPKRVSPVFEFYTKLPEGGGQVADLPAATVAPTALPPTAPVNPSGQAAAPDPIEQLLAQKAQETAPAVPAIASPAPVPGPEVAKTETPKPPAEPAKPTGKGRFLQVGAFRNKAEVEKLRAKITLLGYSPSVQSITNAQGDSLQKVLVGPFRSEQEQEQAKAILGGNGISSIQVK